MTSIKAPESRLLSLPPELRIAILRTTLQGWHIRSKTFSTDAVPTDQGELIGYSLRNLHLDSFISRLSVFHTSRELHRQAADLVGDCVSLACVRTGGTPAKAAPDFLLRKARHVSYYVAVGGPLERGVPAITYDLLGLPALEAVTLDCGIVLFGARDPGDGADLWNDADAGETKMHGRVVVAAACLIGYNRMAGHLAAIEQDRARAGDDSDTGRTPRVRRTYLITVNHVYAPKDKFGRRRSLS